MHLPIGLTALFLFACAACSKSSTQYTAPTGGGGGGGGTGGGASASATIADFQFSPSSISVAVGTTVTWSNNGPSAHTSTSDTGVWNSGSISPPSGGSYGGGGTAGTYQRTFSSAGAFAYHCSFHPQMTGTITVTP